MKLHELFESTEKTVLDELGKHLKHYEGDFFCTQSGITSLEGIPPSINGNVYFANNKIKSLHNIHKQIKHINGGISFIGNPITSHVLGLLLIDGLKMVFLDNTKVEAIINNHLRGERDVFACQEELIEAGFDEFAKL